MSYLKLSVTVTLLFLSSSAFCQPTGVVIIGTTNTQVGVRYISPDASACTLTDSLTSNDINSSMFSGSNQDLSRSSTLVSGRSRTIVLGSRYRSQMDSNGLYRSRALPANTQDTLTITCTGGSVSATFTTANINLGMTYSEDIPGDPANPGNIAWPEWVTNTRGEHLVMPDTGLVVTRATLPQDVPTNFSSVGAGSPSPISGGSGSWACTTNCVFTPSGSSAQKWLFIPLPVSPWTGSHTYADGGVSFDFATIHIVASCSPSCSIEATLSRNANSPISPYVITKSVGTSSSSISIGDGVDGPGGSSIVPILSAWGVTQSNPIDYVMATNGSLNGVTYSFGLLLREHAGGTGTLTINAGSTFDYGTSLMQTIGPSAAEDSAYVCSQASVQKFLSGTPNDVGHLCQTTTGNVFVSDTNFGEITYVGQWGMTYTPPKHGPATCEGNTWDATNPRVRYCSVAGYQGLNWMYKVQFFGDFTGFDPGTNQDSFGILQACGGPITTNCETVTEIDGGVDLDTQARMLNPSINTLKTAGGLFVCGTYGPASQQGVGNNQLQCFNWANQGGMAYNFVFDPATQSVVSSRNSWDTWPNRWGGEHSFIDTRGVPVLLTTGVLSTGSLSGHSDSPGLGPFRSKYTGTPGSLGVAMPNLQACPSQPSGSNVADWPTGNNCVLVTVDGEPCDPSPSWVTGTDFAHITNSVSSSTVTLGISGAPGPAYIGLQFCIPSDNSGTCGPGISGSVFYTLVSMNRATGDYSVSPAVTLAHSGNPVVFIAEPGDLTGACGNSGVTGDYFIQNAQPRDTFWTNSNGPGGTGDPGRYGGGNATYGDNPETFRLLCRVTSGTTCDLTNTSGKSWWLQSNYMTTCLGCGSEYMHHNWTAGQYLYALSMVSLPSEQITPSWDWSTAPLGQEGGNLLNYNPLQRHGFYAADGAATVQAGFSGSFFCGSAPSQTVCQVCPLSITNYAGQSTTDMCFASFTRGMTTPLFQPLIPAFSGLYGCCYANSLDSHPGWYQSQSAPVEKNWYNGTIVFNGDPLVSGSPAHPMTLVAGQLYKMPVIDITAQRGCATWSTCLTYLHALDQIRSTWAKPLVDISGPSSTIGTSAADSYKMCTALLANECVSGSSPGDVYVNAPNVADPYCDAAPPASADSDTVDICIGFHSAYAAQLVQHNMVRTNLYGEISRTLGGVLMRHRVYSPFWNVRASSDSSFGYGQIQFMNNMRSDLLVWKLPPYQHQDSVNRGDYIPVNVPVNVPAGRGIDNIIAEFGYLEYGNQFYCSTNRQENCQVGSGSWGWVSENPSGLPCSSSCTVSIPALSGRALYYHLLYRNGTTVVLTGATQLATTQ